VGLAVETVFDGCKVALMEAIGLYLVSVNQAGLTFSDGSAVPQTWFSYERGSRGVNNPTGVDLFQRLVVEAPPGSSTVVGDLLDQDGNLVKSGTQIARLINVGIYLRKTAAGAVTAPKNIVSAPVVPPCHGNGSGTDSFKALWQKYRANPAPLCPRFGEIEVADSLPPASTSGPAKPRPTSSGSQHLTSRQQRQRLRQKQRLPPSGRYWRNCGSVRSRTCELHVPVTPA
jgi:hypothetical protein